MINLSLGGSSPSDTLKNAVKYAYNNGVTVVAAAGNDGTSQVSYPAAYDDYVIAVGATRYDEALAYYSNYGPSLDLVAPGGDLNVDQNGDGYGDGVLQQTFERQGWRTTWGYYFMEGTSMATPHVSGVSALLIANGTASTPDEVRTALQETAEDKGATGRDDTYGWGLVDAYAALQWTAISNNPPVADAQTVTTDEDTAKDIILTGSDPDGDTITFSIASQPTNGTLTEDANFSANGKVTYTPDTNYNGSDSFTFTVNDGKIDSQPATVSITVNPVNDAPVANDQSVTTDEDAPVNITLTATDVDGDTLSYTVLTNPTNGSLTGTAPDLTYTPNLNYNGSDSFTFKTTDTSNADSNIATVSITVNPVNDAPVADSQEVATDEDTAVSITLTATDVDDDPLTYSIVSGPSNGTLTGTAPDVSYTPNADYNGLDSFTFKANDGTVDSNTATVSITVNPVNDAPVAEDQSVTTSQDTPVAITLTASDVENDTLTYSIVDGPANGSLSGDPPSVTYTPKSGFTGDDSFTFKVNDGQADSNVATVSITVTRVNHPPVANDQSVTTAEDTSVAITLTATDEDDDPLTFIVVTNPTNGSLSGTAPNLTYTPDLDFNGSDSFTFKANDGIADSDPATVSITVTPVNDAPVADGQSVTTDEDTSVAITLTASDVDGDSLTYSVVTGPSHGSLSGTVPNLTYTPNPDYNGSDSFTFKANDGTVDSNTATVSITVTAVNDAPVADNQSVTTDEDTPVDITLTASDVDGDTLTFSIVANPSHGTLSGTAPNVTYTPETGYTGSDSFTFKVNDGKVDSNIATVSITVNPSAPTMHVESIDMRITRSFWKWSQVEASVLITDSSGNPVSDATVTGDWSGAYEKTGVSETTGSDGRASFTSKWGSGIFTFTVTDVSKSGWIYDSSQNKETSDSISSGSSRGWGKGFVLAQNTPNPLNPDTWIPFALDKDSKVTIKIYNITGKLVRKLDLGYLNAGVYVDKGKAAYWDGRNANGERVSSGVYFYLMEAGKFRAMKKMVIMK